MHEMAIADSVLRGVLRHAGGRRVERVHLVVGHLRQVVPETLRFGWDVVTRSTGAEGSILDIEHVAPLGLCLDCGEASLQDGFPFACDACGGFRIEVRQGNELLIDWIEVEDPVPT